MGARCSGVVEVAGGSPETAATLSRDEVEVRVQVGIELSANPDDSTKRSTAISASPYSMELSPPLGGLFTT